MAGAAVAMPELGWITIDAPILQRFRVSIDNAPSRRSFPYRDSKQRNETGGDRTLSFVGEPLCQFTPRSLLKKE